MTLPTRSDGGIDWRGFVLRVCVDQRDYTVFLVRPTPEYKLGEEARLSYLYPHEIGPTIAANTRERCAKWHREKSRIARSCCVEVGERGDEARSAMKLHDESAAAIEEMED